MRVSSAERSKGMSPDIFKALYDEAGHKQAAKSIFYWISEVAHSAAGGALAGDLS
jgi:hypothetical protein